MKQTYRLIISLAFDNKVRIYIADTTKLAKKACLIHKTLPTATLALSNFTTACVMMSLMYKNDEHLSIRLVGDGPIKHMSAETLSGQIKVDIANPDVFLIHKEGPKAGTLDVKSAIGEGLLYVTKDAGLKEAFTSTTELKYSDIAQDFTYYFTTSEQTPSVVALSTSMPNNKIKFAGGYIIQLLPGCPDETITRLEEILDTMPSLSQLIFEGKTLECIIALLSDNTQNILETKPLKYHCNCSKARYRKALQLIPEDELNSMIEDDEGCHIECGFCKKEYNFSAAELIDIASKKKKIAPM